MNLHQPNHQNINTAGKQNGYVLLLVIFSGLILAIGAMVMSARSIDSLIRSGKQSQRDDAKEIAETGASILINELNNNYPYLLTASCRVQNNSVSQQLENPICTGWNSFTLGQFGGPSSACSGRSENPEQMMEKLYKPVSSEKGKYRLRNYEFLGDQIQGGTAIIQVQGQRLNGPSDSPNIAASAIVEQEITVVPKCCNLSPYQTCNSSGWKYALATQNIALQVGDVLDQIRPSTNSNANVHCIDCDAPPADKCTPWTSAGQTITENCSIIGSGIIDGQRSSGETEIPPAPTWNDIRDENGNQLPEEWRNVKPGNLWYESITIGHDNDLPYCVTITNNNKKTTHCRIENINQSGTTTMNLNPEDGDIKFYIEGSQINLSGNNFINTGNFGQFAIYGGVSTYQGTHHEYDYTQLGCNGKQLNLSGGGSIKGFLHMPCFDFNLSGGNETFPVTITGAVISKNYNATGDYARLIVPTETGEIVCSVYGLCSGGGSAMEFAALGSNRWTLIQMERSNNENE